MTLTLQISAGEHPRRDCPVWIERPASVPSGNLWLRDLQSGVRRPVQAIGDQLGCVIDHLDRGQARQFILESGEASDGGVRLSEHGESIAIEVNGAPFTTYHYATEGVRPYFYPLHGPTGAAMTRSYPMETREGESTDHPHHRSLYVAFGEVNGVDVWAEPPHPNTGRIVHQGWDFVGEGPVAARLSERLHWIDGQGTPLLGEQREITLYATRAVRLLDLTIALTPARGAVLFGDTKEGGPLALRVASPLEGKRGGLIQNAEGGRREPETWGKRAPWVDYSGTLNAATVGVAIMDHPTSFRHPTYWHVRDYGLFAANPFGLSAFTGDARQRGDYILPPGETLHFQYRVCLHSGDADAAHVADHYHNFANPPIAVWEG